MSFRLVAFASSIIFLSLVAAGCSSRPEDGQSISTTGGATSTLQEITEEARRLDRTLEDGWIVGRDSRTFKTTYGRTSAENKAQFAVEYAAMVNASGQDMVNRWNSYLPYSTRARFAYKWWQNNPEFKQLTEFKQNVWVHEALLDASELYWRVLEARTNPDNAHVVAHDVEQNMVYTFMENDHVGGTWGDFRRRTANALGSLGSTH